ncbi:hypothetical protein RhiTH_009912 [Rhizoctonia solani]
MPHQYSQGSGHSEHKLQASTNSAPICIHADNNPLTESPQLPINTGPLVDPFVAHQPNLYPPIYSTLPYLGAQSGANAGGSSVDHPQLPYLLATGHGCSGGQAHPSPIWPALSQPIAINNHCQLFNTPPVPQSLDPNPLNIATQNLPNAKKQTVKWED